MKQFHFFTLYLLAALAFSISNATAQSRTLGEPGRVIILDASGSMNSKFGDRYGSSRWDQAKAVVDELGKQLTDRQDTVPTSFMIFGDQGVWADVRSQYPNGPQQYPSTGALCQDVETKMHFGRMTHARAVEMNRLARRARPSGMTPIPIALNQAMDMLDPEHGGIIILVSDMDSPNCLNDQNLCDAIKLKLDKFRDINGAALVEFRIVATPQATFTKELAACAPSTTAEIKPTKPDPEKVVGEILGSFPVSVILEATEPRNIDPKGFANSDVQISVTNPVSGTEVSSGQPGRLPMRSGTYTFTATTKFGTWNTKATVNGPTTVAIRVPGSKLKVEAQDVQAGVVTQLDEVTISRPGATMPLWRDTNIRLPLLLSLGTGQYEVNGRSSQFGTASRIVNVPFNSPANATLSFMTAAVSSIAPVTINVEISNPTLKISGKVYSPKVTLSGVMLATPRDLSKGTNALSLTSGRYQIIVEASPPHVITIDLPSGTVPRELNVTIPPGRFVARARESGGQFELQDSAGKALYSFDKSHVEHSLPDGRYQMVYRSPDGTMPPAITFENVTGQLVRLNF